MMKKLISILTTSAMLLAMTACGSGQVSSSAASAVSEAAQSFGTTAESVPSVPQTADVTEKPQEDSAVASAETVPGSITEPTEEAAGSKTLIAVFSRSGNTMTVANMIQTYTGGDLFEITPAVPYPEDYDTVVDQAKEEQNEQARPAVADTVENWDDYDTVFVSYPDWWSDAPMVVPSFLESYDWNGKKLIPFCTSGGSGFGNSLDSIAASAPGAEIQEGFHVLGTQADGAEADVWEWLSGLGFALAD